MVSQDCIALLTQLLIFIPNLLIRRAYSVKKNVFISAVPCVIVQIYNTFILKIFVLIFFPTVESTFYLIVL